MLSPNLVSRFGAKGTTLPSEMNAGNVTGDRAIEMVNQLQEKLAASGHTLDVSLPQIVVVGPQSSGKSSVLESIVGREFLPRGTGVVTRRPTVVQLEPCEELYAVFSHRGNEKLTDFQEVMAEIKNETNRDPGPVGFSSKPIFLKIYSPNALKLTLVDLPGLIKVAVDNQSEGVVKEVRNMVNDYIKQPNSLILAVSPANQDIATSDALEIAKTVDPKRLRTIGVLTKLDLMDEGTDARDVLDNKRIPLGRGYVGVINRSQKDTEEGRDIQYCIEKEKRFFESNPSYREMAHKMGSPYLQQMLHIELCKHIKECLPAMRQEFYSKLMSFRKELKNLETLTGYRFGGSGEVRSYLIKLVQDFAEELNREMFGLPIPVKMKELTAGALICHKMYTAMQNGSKGPQIPGQKELMTIITNMHGIRNCWSLPSLAMEAVGYGLLSHYLEHLNDCVENVVDILNSCVERTAGTMERYPNLRSELLYLVRKSIDDAAFETKEALEKHLEAEKFFINTYHPDFKFPKSVEVMEDNTYSKISDVEEATKDLTDEWNAVISTLTKTTPLEKNADVLSEMIRRYSSIQKKQITDTAIKYISFFLVNGVFDFIKKGLISAVLGSSKFELLSEDCKKDFERAEEIRKTCNSLNEALNAVQNFCYLSM